MFIIVALDIIDFPFVLHLDEGTQLCGLSDVGFQERSETQSWLVSHLSSSSVEQQLEEGGHPSQ